MVGVNFKISISDYCRYGISSGAQISRHAVYEKADLVNEVANITLKCANLTNFTPLLAPLNFFAQPLKDLDMTLKSLLSFRPFDDILNQRGFVDTKKTVLTLSCLSLCFFNTLRVLSRFKVDVSFVAKALEKIPVLGRLPFGGLLCLSNLALKGATLALLLEKKQADPDSNSLDTNLKILLTAVKVIAIATTTLLVLTNVPTGAAVVVSCAFDVFDLAGTLFALWMKSRPQLVPNPQ